MPAVYDGFVTAMGAEIQSLVHSVSLEGEYDLSRRDEVAALFGALDGNGPAIVDMAKVTYVDSSFLYELVALRSRLKEWGVTLRGVQPPIRRVFQITSLHRLFSIPE
ncbi:MAG TPA: STAS domain-containing protein [Candidatus Cybelea sp.]|jgi:anti-anti-sigma factor|nr:STAS domain-containing protein [Candidatus Cybelea sp.]